VPPCHPELVSVSRISVILPYFRATSLQHYGSLALLLCDTEALWLNGTKFILYFPACVAYDIGRMDKRAWVNVKKNKFK
jgi:hypothetical protein